MNTLQLPPPTLLTDDPLPSLNASAQAIWTLLSDNFWPIHGPATATLRLSNNHTVQTLNHQFRGKNKPTNVLSFPDGTWEANIYQLGDIILAHETITKEAAAQGKTYLQHLQHLMLHGLLHLYGYDHEVSAAEAARMETIEIQLLAQLNIPNPYEEH